MLRRGYEQDCSVRCTVAAPAAFPDGTKYPGLRSQLHFPTLLPMVSPTKHAFAVPTTTVPQQPQLPGTR